MKKHKYKLSKEADSVLDHTITKTNIESDFTIRQVKTNIRALNKNIVELEAKLKIEQAAIENIEHFHPFVKEMSEQDLNTAYMYRESKEYVAQIIPKLEEIKAAIAEDEKSINDAAEQLGLSLDDEDSK